MSDLNTAILGVLADTRDQARTIERASTQDRPTYAAAPGTVTSVALTLPAIFSVTGSPITTAGTLAATLASQSANLVFAGPSTGAAAAPTFRSLVAADLPAGTGTVTSVALSLPAIFSVSGSPVTGSGTLSATLATQTANYIWAGPTSGGAATPTFRAMVSADIPSAIVTYAKIQNVTTARLLGRTTAGAGVVEEISVGSGLTLSGGVLDVAGGGAITGSGTDTYITRWTGASSIGDSNLYLSAGILISATANSGLQVIRTGANATSIITADASFGYSSTLQLGAVDRDGGGATARRAILNLDSAAGTIEAIGNIIFHTDATYDIGAAGATRARDLYLSRSMYAASIKLLGSGSGTATITPPAAAGTPTLTLPTSSGTLALTSQLTASSLSGAFNLSGTTNQITVTGSAAVLLNNAITLSLPQNIHTAATPQFAGVKTAYVYPSADGTTAFQVRKADGTTNIVNVDSTNSRVGVLTSGPLSTVDVVGDFRLVDVSGATLTGVAQTNRFLSIDNTNTDYINLAHYSVNRTRSRGTITVSNSAAAWQNNFVQLMVHGSTHSVNNYCTGTGFSTDAGSAILLAQGSEIQALQIGLYDAKPLHLFTSNVLRMSVHASGAISGTMDTMTYASTISLDVTKANLHKTTTVNATGNATINASAVGTAGQHMWILIVNDATSGKVITFGTNFKSTGTLTGTTSKQATIHFISDGVSWSEVARTLNL